MEIDRLELALEGSSAVSVEAVDALVGALDVLVSSLDKISSPVSRAVRSIDSMSASMQKLGLTSGVTSGMDEVAASVGKLQSSFSSTAAGIAKVSSSAAQSTSNAAQKAADAVAKSTYQARLNAKVAAQEQIQADKVVAAQKIAAIKGAQQVEVAVQKAAMTTSRQTEAQESKAAQAEELMAEKRNQEEAEWAALAEKAAAASQYTYTPSNGGPIREPVPLKQSVAPTMPATPAAPALPAASSGSQELSAFQRIQAAAAQVGQSIKNMFAGSGSAEAEGVSQMDILNAKLDNANEGIRIQELQIEQLRGEWETAFTASGMNDADVAVLKLDNSILSARKSLVSYQSELGKVTEQIQELNNVDDSTASGINRVSRSMNSASGGANGLERSFSRMGRQLASQLIIYSLIWPEISKLGQYTGAALMTNNQFAASLNDLRVQLLTAFNVVYQAAVPAITTLVKWLATGMEYVAAFLSAIFGTTYAAAKSGAQALNNNIKQMQNLSAATKDAKKNLDSLTAGFDELNILNANDDSGSSGVPSDLQGLENTNFGSDKPPISATDIAAITGDIKKALPEIAAIVSGASLALGAILTFTGVNIPLGIALMAAGVTGITALSLNWDALSPSMKGSIAAIAAIVSPAFLALGAIFAFTGVNIPLGIAFMVMGVAGIAAAALNWDALSPSVKGTIAAISGIVGIASLVLGAIFAFTGINIPLGIAFMLIGATGVAAAALNWDALSPSMKGVITAISGIVGMASLVLGAVFAFTGVNIPLGIAFLAIGATGVAAAALNWSALSPSIKGTIAAISGIVGIASLVLGAVFAFTGVNIPLGIAFMLIGATGVAAAALNWDALSPSMKGTIATISAIVGAASLVLGAVFAFTGVNIPLGIALMVIGAATLATDAVLNWDAINNAVKGPVGVVTALVGGALLALGAILCFSGVGIPLGLGMMAAGGLSLAAAIAPNWNAITDKIKGVWTDIKSFLNNDIIAGVESFINGIIGGFNKLISFLDKFQITAPAWVTQLTGITSFGFNIPQFGTVSLPRLYNGGLAYQETLAAVGDYPGANSNPEVIAPLDKLKSIINDGSNGSNSGDNDEVVSLLQTLITTVDNKDFSAVTYMDSRKVAQSVRKANRSVGAPILGGKFAT